MDVILELVRYNVKITLEDFEVIISRWYPGFFIPELKEKQMKFEKTNSLFLPKKTEKEKQKEIGKTRGDLPRFILRQFECYYKNDIDKFKELVESRLGIFVNSISVGSIRENNEYISPSDFFCSNYVCLYYYYEDIDMEVCC